MWHLSVSLQPSLAAPPPVSAFSPASRGQQTAGEEVSAAGAGASTATLEPTPWHRRGIVLPPPHPPTALPPVLSLQAAGVVLDGDAVPQRR